MKLIILKSVSVLLHPVFIPLFTALFIFNLNVYPFNFIPKQVLYQLLILISAFNVIFPLLLMLFLKKTAFFTNFDNIHNKERIILLIIYALMLYLTATIFKKLSIPPLWNIILLLFAILALLLSFITVFYKISLHLAGWGGLCALVFFLIYTYGAEYLLLFSVIVLLSGISAWCRTELNAHKPTEVIAGFLAGNIIVLLGLFFIFPKFK